MNRKQKILSLFFVGAMVFFSIFLFLIFQDFFLAKETKESFQKEVYNDRILADDKLEIVRSDGEKFEIDIEIADNKAGRNKGLMWRRELPEFSGMLFIFPEERNLSFWMKNTYLSLDIIFADSSGQIVSIHPEAKALSEASIFSNQPARYALEVNAGFVAKHGIKEGDFIYFQRMIE